MKNMVISQAEFEILEPLQPEIIKKPGRKSRMLLAIPDAATWIKYKDHVDTFVDQSRPFNTAWRLSDKFMRKMGMTHEEQGYHERYPGIWVA